MSHAMNAAACTTLERLGYEWKSLDGRHWDWYAPVPAAQDFSLMQGGYCCECGHELCDTCAPLHPIMPWPAAQAVDVDAICNAYESGVGHRGRPTANVNPYREGTPEHKAYAIGAKGEAAQAEAKVADALEHAGTRAEFHPDSEIAVLCRKAAAALRARAVPEGYALVPVEPTNEMYHAGVNAISSVWMNPEGTAPVGGYGAYVRRVWPAMLAAKANGGGA